MYFPGLHMGIDLSLDASARRLADFGIWRYNVRPGLLIAFAIERLHFKATTLVIFAHLASGTVVQKSASTC